jgi:hypothetical protein
MQGFWRIALLLSLAISGCVSLSSSNPPPPSSTTVVVPSGSNYVCDPAPCR